MRYILSAMCVLLIAILFYDCNSGSHSENGGAESEASEGQKIYSMYCVACHGSDGKLGLNEASDLTQSTLSEEEIQQVVKNGKGMMTPYKGILKPEQIEAVAEFAKYFQSK